ncbi:hypothetical protein, partial [Acinetobacter baumannii]|uniref:hypothetical protein n=1 Tax=Acinetobacter baumannii TaxID=470 RepID=UPI001D17A27C
MSCTERFVEQNEFHHVSADADNILGTVLKSLMDNTTAHIVAMTGSYFRGDSVPVLLSLIHISEPTRRLGF